MSEMQAKVDELEAGMSNLNNDMTQMKGDDGQLPSKGLGSEEAEEMKKEVNALKEKLTEAEDKLEDIKKENTDVKEQVEKLENQQYENQYEYASVGQVDSKLQSLLEKLKVNNQVEWKQTVSLAEKQFSEEGIKNQINLLPQHLQGVPELKQTINTIATDYVDDREKGHMGEENKNLPKPQINSQ